MGVGVDAVDDQRIPFDLWPARSLPALAVVDRVVLVLAGFDLAAEISPEGRRLRIVPIARPVEITREYSVPRQRQTAFNAYLADLPSEKVRRLGMRTEVSAPWEEHERLRAVIRGVESDQGPAVSAPGPRSGKQQGRTFTLKIESQPVDRVIDKLGGQLGLTVQWVSEPPQGSVGLVSCDVREADLDELLKAVLSPAGLTFERQNDKITIRPSP